MTQIFNTRPILHNHRNRNISKSGLAIVAALIPNVIPPLILLIANNKIIIRLNTNFKIHLTINN